MNQTEKHPLYFLAILPPSEIRNEIRSFKETIEKKHGVKHALKLPAHITLQIPFRISKEQEVQLVRELTSFSYKIDPFKVELDGFGHFSKNVIFVKICKHEAFIKLHSELQEMITSFIDLKSHEISSKIHPHLTIAVRDLKRSNFLPIWKDFENREYKNSFMAKTLVLLKHNGKTWDIREEFKFSN